MKFDTVAFWNGVYGFLVAAAVAAGLFFTAALIWQAGWNIGYDEGKTVNCGGRNG
jgi:hypothetical protein